MTRVSRYAGIAAGIVVIGVGATGCRTSPGAAALVGDQRISVAALQREVDHALADPQARTQLAGTQDARITFTRTELTRLITNRIIAAAAAAHHISATTAEVDQELNQFAAQAGGQAQLLQQAEQSGIPRAELPSFTRYYVLEQKLGDSLVASVPVSQAQLQAAYQQNINSYDQVHSAHILVKTKAEADRILAKVRKNHALFPKLAAQYSIDTSNKDNGGDLGFAGRTQFVPSFSRAIFAAKPGTFIEVHSKFGWHVVHIIAHRHVSLAQATPELKASLLKNTRDQLLHQAERAEAKKLGVHVNPRYGMWDFNQGAVVALPTKDSVSSPSPSPSAG